MLLVQSLLPVFVYPPVLSTSHSHTCLGMIGVSSRIGNCMFCPRNVMSICVVLPVVGVQLSSEPDNPNMPAKSLSAKKLKHTSLLSTVWPSCHCRFCRSSKWNTALTFTTDWLEESHIQQKVTVGSIGLAEYNVS